MASYWELFIFCALW